MDGVKSRQPLFEGVDGGWWTVLKIIPSCGCPVRYRRTPVVGKWNFFKPEFIGPDAFWAEPMIDDAAHTFRLVV